MTVGEDHETVVGVTGRPTKPTWRVQGALTLPVMVPVRVKA
eukprot:gene10515-20852_t